MTQRTCKLCARVWAGTTTSGNICPRCSHVPAAAKRAVLAEGPCVYCGDPVVGVDHLRPLTEGGSHDPANLVPACLRCNLLKGSRCLDQAGWRVDLARAAAASPKVRAELVRIARDLARGALLPPQPPGFDRVPISGADPGRARARIPPGICGKPQ